MGETVVSDGQEVLLKSRYIKTALVNAQQSVTITGGPGGGTFKLAWEGSALSGTIAYNAVGATVQTALEALSTIGSGNVSVSGGAGGPYTVTFIGILAGTPAPLLTKDASGLTGGSSPNVSIAQTVAGVGTIPRYYYLGLSHSTRETLGDDVAMSAIDEVTGTGYARIRLKTDGTDIVVEKIAGFWRIRSKVVTFLATGSDWIQANAAFLTDMPDNSGKVLGIQTVTPFTLANTRQQVISLTEVFADAA